MPSLSSFRTVLVFALVATLAAGGGLWLAWQMQASGTAMSDQATLRDGPFLRLPQAKPLADFALYDDAGEPWSKTSLQGSWTLVFFGFTNCPHVCPDTLFRLTEAVRKLDGRLPPERLPAVLFIGVDPERDTPAALQRYRARFGGDIEAVSGPDAQLRALAVQLGAHYVVPDHEPDQWYNVDHSVNVLLLDPGAQWVGVFSAPHDSDAIADALARFLGGEGAPAGP